MARNRVGTDGRELEWSIQDRYVKSAEGLGLSLVPMVLEFHKGNAAGGKTFMTKGIPDTRTTYMKLGDTSAAYHVWIEFKRHNGKVSPDQAALHKRMRLQGEDVIVCYSAEEAINALADRIGLVDQRRKT